MVDVSGGCASIDHGIGRDLPLPSPFAAYRSSQHFDAVPVRQHLIVSGNPSPVSWVLPLEGIGAGSARLRPFDIFASLDFQSCNAVRLARDAERFSDVATQVTKTCQ